MSYTATCCGKKVDEEEYILNHGMCNTCMDKGGTVMAYRYLCGECVYEVEKPLTKGEIIRVQGSLRIVNSVDRRVIELGGIGAMQEAKYIGTLDQLDNVALIPKESASAGIGWYVNLKKNGFSVMQDSPFSEIVYSEEYDDMDSELRSLKRYLIEHRATRVLLIAGVGTKNYHTKAIEINGKTSFDEFRKLVEPMILHEGR